MMNVDVYDPLPATLFQSLVAFSEANPSNRWSDVYRMMSFLSSRFPGTTFRAEPFHYLDLRQKRSGLLFVEHDSEKLYFVYETRTPAPTDVAAPAV